MSKIKAIISDADGTLVNTVYMIRHGQFEATVEYLLTRNIPRKQIPSYEKYENYINKSVGGSTRDTFEKTLKLLFGKIHDDILSNIDFAELDASLGPIQDHIAPLYVHPFHGLTELFTWSGTNKVGLGIFTSGNPHHIVRNFGVSLPVLGFTDLFRNQEVNRKDKLDVFIARAKAVYGIPNLEVVTCEDVTKTKPDPEGIKKLMAALAVKPDEVIVLGDHPVDMEAAMAAGVNPIGISHGFGTPADLKEAGAIRIVDDLASIPRLINKHNEGISYLF